MILKDFDNIHARHTSKREKINTPVGLSNNKIIKKEREKNCMRLLGCLGHYLNGSEFHIDARKKEVIIIK